MHPEVLLVMFPVSNSVWESAAQQQNIRRHWICVYCFQASSIKLYCVCEERLFSSSREKPTNPSAGVGFPWPTPGQVGGIRGKNRSVSFVHSPLPFILCPPPLFPFLQHFAFSCLISFFMLFFSFPHSSHCAPSPFLLKRKWDAFPN